MAFPPSPLLVFARSASEEEARLVASNIVGPEHLFLALLWPEAASGPTVLSAYGITLQRARVAMHELTAWGGEPRRGTLPVAVATERAYEIAVRYAEGDPVSYGDLLVGVLSVRSPTLERVLVKLGITKAHLRASIQKTESRTRSGRTGSRAPDGSHAVERVDASPPPAPAPDVIDLRRRSATSPGIGVPGEVEPHALEHRVAELSERVDALLATVSQMLDRRS